MFEPLLAACPSFEPAWRAFVEEAGRYPNEQPLYHVAAEEFARHLVVRLHEGSNDELAVTFQVVERLISEGESYVREAMVTGLLEGIQNIAGDMGVDPDRFKEWLLPETRAWWDNLNRFWDGESGALREL